MRKSLFVGAAIVAVACLAGCKKEAPVAVVTVDSESVVSFPLGGGQGTIKFQLLMRKKALWLRLLLMLSGFLTLSPMHRL